MEPKFDRYIETRELTYQDALLLVGSVRDETGRPLSVWEILADHNTRRITAARDIDTGEMKTEVQAKTHDGKPLPYFVVRVER